MVDDDRSCTEVVARLLLDRGYAVDVAFEGAAALELVTQHSYALLVLDYQMPGMNGVDVYRRATELRPGLVGILLTTYPRVNVVFPAIDSRVERVLAKPVDADEFVPLVEQMIGPGGAGVR
ncbi:MAG TPA: response regulator [Pirellulales bacterium]|nr:response regulator [Pirellulales bacterium]